MTEREINIHCARVYLAQVRVFLARGQRGFAMTLLQWAANCRRRAMKGQMEMFG